jgi:hypothetical protein
MLWYVSIKSEYRYGLTEGLTAGASRYVIRWWIEWNVGVLNEASATKV